jgi:hypothetical protein
VKKAAVAMLVALALAACSDGDDAITAKEAAANGKAYVPPKTVATDAPTTTTPTTLPQKPADALALAARLGCANPEASSSDDSVNLPGFPKTTGSVSCTLPDGTDISVQTYTREGIEAIKGPVIQGYVCTLVRGFGGNGPFYTTLGADFEVDVTANDLTNNDPNYRAKSQAIADALGLPLTTIECKDD